MPQLEDNLTDVLRKGNYKNIILQLILWKRQLTSLRNFMEQLKEYLQLTTSSNVSSKFYSSFMTSCFRILILLDTAILLLMCTDTPWVLFPFTYNTKERMDSYSNCVKRSKEIGYFYFLSLPTPLNKYKIKV